jgi:transcriptional regulator with XRE-family HTH domain
MKLAVKTKVLIETRIRRGLSQTELAARAGISSGYISQIERGLYGPSPRVAKRIAMALGVGFDSIFFLEDPQLTKNAQNFKDDTADSPNDVPPKTKE